MGSQVIIRLCSYIAGVDAGIDNILSMIRASEKGGYTPRADPEGAQGHALLPRTWS